VNVWSAVSQNTVSIYNYNASSVCSRLERFLLEKKINLFSKTHFANRGIVCKFYNADVVTRCNDRRIGSSYRTRIAESFPVDSKEKSTKRQIKF
jgi:hypothetical protein